ncbi:hypothetical protein ES703_05074 [subsurface metagenome]
MKEKIALVIAVLMMTSMAFAISTTNVSATHTTTVSIDDDTVKAGTLVRTITIQNAGPAPIDNVRIILPSGFSNFAPTKKVPEDNIVEIEVSTNNLIILPAGTLVQLATTEAVELVENTDVIRLENTWVYVPDWGENAMLKENGLLEVRQATNTQDNLVIGDNVAPVLDKELTLTTDNRVRVLADTQVVLVSGNTVKLPENALVEVVVDDNATGYGSDENVTLKEEKTVTLQNKLVRTVNLVNVRRGGVSSTNIDAGVSIELYVDNNVVLPVGTKVKFTSAATVTILENTDVIRPAENQLELISLAENQPKNWMQTTGVSDPLSAENAVEWKGIGDNKIASGGSLAFPFAVTTPGTGTYTIYVRTTDNLGDSSIKEITLNVDGDDPTATVTASPRWVKDNQVITITVMASESLAKLENVMVAENNAPENTQIVMTPNVDNTEWTGSYMTGDNSKRDGTAKIYVIGSQFEDYVGNKGSSVENTITIDRLKPLTPIITALTGFPTSPTNDGSWTIEGTAQDNFMGGTVNLENGTVKIRFGTTVVDVTANAVGYFYETITLTEGTKELGIQYIDLAGNVGTENAENIIYDATAPTVSITSPASGAYTKDNTPSISLTIADTVIGVENDNFSSTDNSGYLVYLRRDDNTVITQLTPKVDPTEKQFKSYTFENDYPTELTDNWYNIFVQAGDNLQKDNTYSRFKVDVTVPSAPTLDVTASTNIDNPTVIKAASRTVTGTAEAGAKIKVYFNGAEQTALETTADATTGDWTVIVAPTPGTITKIEFRVVDKAGNEGGKKLYGYLLVDGSEPTVAITAPESGISTDATSIILEATVDKDTWEEYSELTVRIDATSLTAPITATNVLTTDGKLTRAVELVEGSNTISVSAQDVAGNWSTVKTVTVTRTVTPWATYAIVIVIVALILAAIAIFRKR